ncbi:helix-turn-helix domain-containing protein [Kitasatospora sp. NPDC049285]|uniref:ArsR/SmtB family transcription factor n=1 Tax=Kitasatospora sp. NPDC049285 TaxID=3157096 RepID=UPI003435B5FD
MLRIDLDLRALANTRFAISPLHTTADSLWLIHRTARPSPRGWGPLVRQSIRERGLTVLHSLYTGAWRYIPDFLQPVPHSHDEVVERELHEVATADPSRIAAELSLMLTGSTRLKLAGGTPQRPLLNAIERGEQAFAERVAAELHQLWETAVAPRWPALRSRLENDIAHRAHTISRYGLGSALGSLDPRIAWNGDHLLVTVDFCSEIRVVESLVLMPAVFGSWVHALLDPFPDRTDRRAPILDYPALPLLGVGGPPASPAGELIGDTRARLLADLVAPRTTAELAERHRLAASTVSYHLGVLLRSGLLVRTRQEHRVLYRQSPRAREVV